MSPLVELPEDSLEDGEKISSSADTGQADMESPEEELVVELGEERLELNTLLTLCNKTSERCEVSR